MTTANGRAMFVAAHPDDPDFLAGGTVARLVREGREFTHVIVTNGNKGSADRSVRPEQFGATREAEQRRAARALGVAHVEFLGYEDGELEKGVVMKTTVVMLTSLLILVSPLLALAGPNEEVSAATQSWIDGMNGHDMERVVALYDAEAVLWGTRSSTLRDTQATVRDYFKILQTVPPSYKVVLGEQRIRTYGDIAINTGTDTFSEDRDGKTITRPSRFSFVYRNRNGRWVIVDHHSSAVPAQ